MNKVNTWLSAVAAAATCFVCSQSPAAFYAGNSNTGFGGALGTGGVTLTDDGTTISGTFNRGSGNHNDILVIYIDSGASGFSTTSGFNDQDDDLRRAISGVGWDGRSTANFAAGFDADYAIAIHNNNFTFGGLWSLANGNNGSLNFLTSVNLSGGGNAQTSYTFDFDLADIGLAPNSGASFDFVATYTAASGYRSNEAIGASDAPGGGTNVALGTLNFSDWETYATLAPIPEPGTFLVWGLAMITAGLLTQRERR
jgi:hypothetical protein